MPETVSLARDLRALSQAGIALSSELSLQAVLQKVVDIARAQVDARYAAMSVLDDRGVLRQFLYAGITEEERERIGATPQGKGLLGVLLRQNQALRLSDVESDPRSVGFPPNHPRMKSLLGVPVVYRDRIIGNLYLADKQDGTDFTDWDEEIVLLFAAQAAIAIHNAELYEEANRRAEEWKALFELGRDITASPDVQRLLQSTVSRARDLLKTDVSVIMLLTADGRNLQVAAHEGLRTEAMAHLRLLSEHGLQGYALETMKPVIVEDYYKDQRLRHRPARLVAEEGLVSQICVPLVGKGGALGTLTVGNRAKTHFPERSAELLEAFANWTGVAIEASRLYEKLESLARLEERERIGMDLHDGVIQSIYAVGLGLEDVLYRIGKEPPDETRADVEKAMDDLTKVIKDIRSYIFELRPRVSEVSDLPEAIRQLVQDIQVNALIDADLKFTGRLDGMLDRKQALALFHIAQEALNNVHKHSRATNVRVILAADDRSVSLEVSDNGVGFKMGSGGGYEKHGLRNMRDRARSVGGELEVESRPGEGTAVRAKLARAMGADSEQ